MDCIIVDDEPLAREGMEILINQFSKLNLIGKFSNATTAKEFLITNKVDLIFLDIEMPGITGIEFLANLKKDILTIFTTAYSEYALKGFDLNVVDYLLKPIRKDRFAKAIDKAHEIFILKNSTLAKQELKERLDYTYVAADRKYYKVFFDDIKYIEGMKDYVVMHTKDKKIMPAINLKTIYGQLPNTLFARVNKSYIVNIKSIKKIDAESIDLGTITIPIGKSYKDDFLNNFVKNNLIKR